MICPSCGYDAPKGCMTCWKCGACLNLHVVKLAEAKK